MSVWRKSWPSDAAAAIADDALGDRPLQTQRIAYRKDRVAGIDVISITQDDVTWFQIGRKRKLEQGQIDERIERDDLDVFDAAAAEPSRNVHVEDGRDPALTLDHVIVGDRVAVFVDQEARPLARWRLDRDDRLAKLADQLFDRRGLEHTGGVKTRAVFLERPAAGTGARGQSRSPWLVAETWSRGILRMS